MAVTVISLFLGQYLSLKGDLSSFFLLHTRCWEILVGSCIALYLRNNSFQIKKNYILPLEALALVMIVTAVLSFDEKLPLPGFLTLLPVGATCLIILVSNQKTKLGKVLSHKHLVGIGLISYSAYLWHQPLFAFARRELEVFSPLISLLLIFLTFMLAYLSWRFVETPFRTIIGRKRIIVFGVASTLGIFCIGTFLKNNSHDLTRFSSEKRPIIKSATMNVREAMKAFDRGGCFIDFHQTFKDLLQKKCVQNFDNTVVLFGDSYAAHHFIGLKKALKTTDYSVQQWTATSCRAVNFPGNNKRCREFYHHFLDHISDKFNDSSTIIVSSHWINTFHKIGEKQFTQSVSEMLTRLSKSKARIVILGQSPTFSANPFLHLLKAERYSNVDEFMKPRDGRKVNQVLSAAAKEHRFEFINPYKTLCKQNGAEEECFIKKDNNFLYFDVGHLSPEGSIAVWKNFKSKFLK